MINSDYDNSIWYKYEVSSKKNSSKINIKLYRFLGFSKMMYDKILWINNLKNKNFFNQIFLNISA